MKITKKSGVDLQKIIKDVNTTKLRVGWSEKAKYDDGPPVASVAAQNEFGNPAKNIPPRPFMRPTAIENSDSWKTTVNGLFKRVLSGRSSAATAMEIFGLQVAGQVRAKIASIDSPPLSQRTIEARIRGRKVSKATMATRTLVDTGYMLNSITSEVQS